MTGLNADLVLTAFYSVDELVEFFCIMNIPGVGFMKQKGILKSGETIMARPIIFRSILLDYVYPAGEACFGSGIYIRKEVGCIVKQAICTYFVLFND